jgi:hypothetical protein
MHGRCQQIGIETQQSNSQTSIAEIFENRNHGKILFICKTTIVKISQIDCQNISNYLK